MPGSTLSPPATGGTVNADLLKDRVPAWFTLASTQRQTELSNYELHLPSWYHSATPEQQAALASRHKTYREALNQLETRLASFNDVFDFAEQPLKDAIKAQFNLDLDVRNMYFARKYAFKDRDDFSGFWCSTTRRIRPSTMSTGASRCWKPRWPISNRKRPGRHAATIARSSPVGAVMTAK